MKSNKTLLIVIILLLSYPLLQAQSNSNCAVLLKDSQLAKTQSQRTYKDLYSTPSAIDNDEARLVLENIRPIVTENNGKISYKPQINYNGINVYGIKDSKKISKINCRLLEILIEHSTKPIYIQFFSEEVFINKEGVSDRKLYADYVIE